LFTILNKNEKKGKLTSPRIRLLSTERKID